MRRVEGAVCLHQPVARDSCRALQGVDVLRVVPQQEPLLLQQAHEQVRGCGAEVAGVQLAGKAEEGLWKGGEGINSFPACRKKIFAVLYSILCHNSETE